MQKSHLRKLIKMKLSDFCYDLPKKLIAQEPVQPRTESKLMLLHLANDEIEHRKFSDIIEYFHSGDILVVNETKVIKAKLTGKKQTGGKIEVLIEKQTGEKTALCKVKGNVKEGNGLIFPKKIIAEIIKKESSERILEFSKPIKKVIEEIGEMPLPPYIKKKLKKDSQYQTAYAKKEGSLAAPTAGFHFSKELLKKIESKGVKIAKVCLHVSYSTFAPILTENVEEHKMHPEMIEIDAKTAAIINDAIKEGRRIFAAGTTTMKTLETAASKGFIKAGATESSLFIYPGYKFKINYSGMITNFHLPKSSLILLVSALAGREKILNAYKEAITKQYRFFSFGDAMLIMR